MAEANAQLNGIDSGIRRGESRVRNVHEADFRADVVLAAEKVQAYSSAGGEIDLRRAGRRLHVSEQRAPAKFEIGNHAPVRVQRPFESERVHSGAVGSAAFLNDEKRRNDVDRVFQTPAEKPGTVRRGENQSVAQAEIPNAVAGLTSVCAVASTGPDLQFVAALNGACLRAGSRDAEKGGEENGGDSSIQRRASFVAFDSRNAARDAKEDIENWNERRISPSSLEVGANDLDNVVGGFLGRSGIAGHMVSDVVFHQFGHEAVDGAASGGEALESVGARLVFIEGAEDTFELANNFLGAIDEVEFFAGGMRHFQLAYPIGVWYQGYGPLKMAR
jgi:hypothetical protein